MSKQQYSDLSFSQLTVLREHALSWICYDTGLLEFLYPDHPDTPSIAPEKRRAHVNAVIETLLKKTTEAGRAAYVRTSTRDAAARLRRMTDRLRDHKSFTHRDVAKMSVLLESLWDDVNVELSDRKWARCSMRFDTALITLRVTYVLTYLNAECLPDTHSIQVRKNIYKMLIDKFFSPSAPTDDPQDKHSHNFKDLVGAWHNELASYVDSSSFEEKLARLGNNQKPEETAKYVLRFLDELSVDHSWLLDAVKLEADFKSGALQPAQKTRGRPKKDKNKRTPLVSRLDPDPELQEPDSSSFEPAAHDSDFNAEGAEDQDNQDEDEEDADYRANTAADQSGTRRNRGARNDGDMVRRSLRVARAGVHRRQGTRRTRKGPERYSEIKYPTGRAPTPDGKIMTRRRRTSVTNGGNVAMDVEEHHGDEADALEGEIDENQVSEEEDFEMINVGTRAGVRTRSSPRKKGNRSKRPVGRPRKQRLIENDDDDDMPLRESQVSEEVARLSQRLDPDSQTFESTGLSDVDEMTATLVRRRRIVRALEKVQLTARAAADEVDGGGGGNA